MQGSFHEELTGCDYWNVLDQKARGIAIPWMTLD